MNKKGFTLVEILAVVTIISLIFIIALPNLINSLNSKKSEIDSVVEKLIIDAAKLYVSDYSSNFEKKQGNVYCLPLTTLTDNKYLENPIKNITYDEDITDTKSVKISYNKGFIYEIVNMNNCKTNNLSSNR